MGQRSYAGIIVAKREKKLFSCAAYDSKSKRKQVYLMAKMHLAEIRSRRKRCVEEEVGEKGEVGEKYWS